MNKRSITMELRDGKEATLGIPSGMSAKLITSDGGLLVIEALLPPEEKTSFDPRHVDFREYACLSCQRPIDLSGKGGGVDGEPAVIERDYEGGYRRQDRVYCLQCYGLLPLHGAERRCHSCDRPIEPEFTFVVRPAGIAFFTYHTYCPQRGDPN